MEVFHDLTMLKCSIKIKKKLLQMGNIRLIGFSDCSCRLTSIMYCNWEGGGLSSRVLEPCALLSEACAVPFWLLGANCLGVR